MKILSILIYVYASFLFAGCLHKDPVKQDPGNPHYFSWKGKPVVLITTDQHYGAVINMDFDYIAFLDRLHEFGMNLTRIYPGGYIEMKDQYTAGNPLGPSPDRYILPWKRSSEKGANEHLGTFRYDLDQWDPEYFARLKDFVKQAAQREIVVEIAFFNGMYDDRWAAQPLFHTNNIQGVGHGEYQLFTTTTDPALNKYQAEYVKKIARELYSFDNIIYDICDEPEMQHKESLGWNSMLLDALISVDHNRHLCGETANSASPDMTGDKRVTWIPTEYISPMENTLKNDYVDNKPIVDVETAYYSYWYGSHPVDESRAESWYGMLGGLAGFIQLNSDFSVTNSSGKGTSTQDTILPQKRVLKNFMYSLDFVKMKRFTDYSVADTGVISSAIAENGQQYAAYLFHGWRKWEDWPQGWSASRVNTVVGKFTDTLKVILPEGHYKAEWVCPVNGFVINSVEVTGSGSPVNLVTPEYKTDIALRLKRI